MIKPLKDRVVVKRFEPETKTPTGIILPDTQKKAPDQGKVMAAGLACIEVKTGHEVMFNRYAGTEVDINGEKYLIMTESEILAIL